METDNFSPEQIENIAELLGQKKNASYCTLNKIALNITAVLYCMLGRDFQGKTVNYQCVVDALKELPSTAFDALQTLILSINEKDEKHQKVISEVRKYDNERDKLKSQIVDLHGIAQRNNFRAVMFEHLLLQKSNLGQIITEEVQAEYSAKTVLEKDIGWMENRSRDY